MEYLLPIGSVRHAGAAITSGLRYVLAGFIALEDRVEHVRRLNERGHSRALRAAAEGGDGAVEAMEGATDLFKLGCAPSGRGHPHL